MTPLEQILDFTIVQTRGARGTVLSWTSAERGEYKGTLQKPERTTPFSSNRLKNKLDESRRVQRESIRRRIDQASRPTQSDSLTGQATRRPDPTLGSCRVRHATAFAVIVIGWLRIGRRQSWSKAKRQVEAEVVLETR